MQEKDRKQVPDIPGVKKGADFFRGISVEMGGQKSGSKRRIEFGETSLDLCLIKLGQAGYMSLPFLGREKSDKSVDLWEPRVDPMDGSVITWRWENRKKDKEDYSDCVAFAGRKIGFKFNYNEVPGDWTLATLVPQRIKEGIEAAMRQQDELVHDYKNDGPENLRVDETFDLLYETSGAFVMGEVNGQDDLKSLAKMAEEHFKVHGLLESNDPIWQRVVTYTLKAVEKDSLNRINPLISRVRARAAFLAGTEREMIARSAGTKAEKVYRHLEVVRAATRLKMRMAIDTLDDLCGFSRGKLAQDQVMFEGSETSTTRQGWVLEQYLKVISNDVLRSIQPAPYLVPATAGRVILTGETAFKINDDKQAVLEILEGRGYLKFLDSSAVRWLREKRPLVARTRMLLVYRLLKQCLEDPKTTDTRVFD
jgi:hypothetical protein